MEALRFETMMEVPCQSLLRVGVCVNVYLFGKLLDSYFYVCWGFFCLLKGFQESEHDVCQCFLHEMVQGHFNVVNLQFGLIVFLQNPMTRTQKRSPLK